MKNKEKRKIVIIGSAYPLRGGLATYNERLAKAYQQNGDEVIIYTFKLQYPKLLFPGKTQYSTDPPPENLNIKIAINSINPFNWFIIGWKIKKIKPDLVIIKFWIPFMALCLGTIARLIRSKKHTKIISIIDNIIPHEKRVGDRMLAKYFVKSVDGFIAMSKTVSNDLETFDKQKPKRFCPHPLYDNFGYPIPKNVAKKTLNLNENTNYILFFGFIRDYKGLDLLLEALGNKCLKELPLKLIVAGEFYTDSKPYFDIIKKNNLKDKVIMINDFIPDSYVLNYFCACDIVVQPYKDATQSGVTQIAYHFNKPMIITDVGGLAEIVPDGKVGYVVERDSEKIAEAILKFYDENKEQEFIENIKEEKKKYSWERMLESIDLLFK
ncbi:MAG: glycosyltransferase [Bacteroidales bacterium]|nr:glycosyltransferase [Bacteroidales bacterium]